MGYKADLNAYNLRGDNAIWLCILRGMQALLAELVLSGRCDLNAGEGILLTLFLVCS
jgi:hypothetical protein